jgi:pyruvate/2-oxoglutarate dehydrogenase complex dihydrolipoamide acyltransferase (E2) component
MTKIVPFTKHREVVYDLLTRAKRFHCPVTSCWDVEVSALEAARPRLLVNGRPVGLTACLVRATALTLKEHPRLNHHLFHGLLGKYEVDFEEIRCNLVVARRGPDGETIVLPLVIERADEVPLAQVQETIDHHRTAPLASLPQFAALERLKRLPRLALSWFSWRVRSDHRVYSKYFGTYGVSTLPARGASAHALSTLANTGAAFLCGSVQARPVVKGGVVAAGQVLTIACVADHFLVDGLEVLDAMRTLNRLLSRPERLGLPGGA